MIISSFQDLPRDICPVCGSALKLSTFAGNPPNTYYCDQYDGSNGWSRESHSHYGICLDGATINTGNFQLDFDLHSCNLLSMDNIRLVDDIKIIELDFSDLSKLEEKLQTLVNFS